MTCDADSIDDWLATEVAFTTVRPLPTTPLPAQGQAPATLSSGVKLEGHPSLRAKARLASAPLATRDIGNVTLPRLLCDDPSICQPLTFTASRGSDPGLSVLELTDVNDPALVTPDAPLRVTVPLALQTNEHVLPVAYDGEFFLPLGRVGKPIRGRDRDCPRPAASATGRCTVAHRGNQDLLPEGDQQGGRPGFPVPDPGRGRRIA